MNQPYIAPAFKTSAFHCPHCQVFADQRWDDVFARPIRDPVRNADQVPGLVISLCAHCSRWCLWVNGEMVFPDSTGVPSANEDMPDEIKDDYYEAASIVNKSPRGAAALLRLAIQKLCVVLGEKGKNINEDVASLVKKGLPIKIQQALDIVRVIGNEAVHPGALDLTDDIKTATELFSLTNIIAEIMISQPKRIGDLYGSLPEDKRKAIEDRDKPKTK
jgi:hypothetical protein